MKRVIILLALRGCAIFASAETEQEPEGGVAFVDPTLPSGTRTLKARLELPTTSGGRRA